MHLEFRLGFEISVLGGEGGSSMSKGVGARRETDEFK